MPGKALGEGEREAETPQDKRPNKSEESFPHLASASRSLTGASSARCAATARRAAHHRTYACTAAPRNLPRADKGGEARSRRVELPHCRLQPGYIVVNPNSFTLNMTQGSKPDITDFFLNTWSHVIDFEVLKRSTWPDITVDIVHTTLSLEQGP